MNAADILLERLASEALAIHPLMPRDYGRFYQLAHAANQAQAVTGTSVGDVLMRAFNDDTTQAARAYAVARCLQGMPVPRIKPRRARKEIRA